MITLIFLICLVLCIVFHFLANRYKSEICSWIWFGFGVLAVVSLVPVIDSIYSLAMSVTIDREIQMYEEENARIEERLEATVSNYLQYESTTLKELKDTDAISLISLYPELKSDKLVQSQIEVYISNNKEIKALKKRQIEVSRHKYNLYFGR